MLHDNYRVSKDAQNPSFILEAPVIASPPLADKRSEISQISQLQMGENIIGAT